MLDCLMAVVRGLDDAQLVETNRVSWVFPNVPLQVGASLLVLGISGQGKASLALRKVVMRAQLKILFIGLCGIAIRTQLFADVGKRQSNLNTFGRQPLIFRKQPHGLIRMFSPRAYPAQIVK